MLHFASNLVRSLTQEHNTCNDPGLASNPAQKSPHFLVSGLQTLASQKNYCSNPDPHCDEHTENRQIRDLVLIYHQISSFATEKPTKKGLLMKTCFCLTIKKVWCYSSSSIFAQTCFNSLHNSCSNKIVQREKRSSYWNNTITIWNNMAWYFQLILSQSLSCSFIQICWNINAFTNICYIMLQKPPTPKIDIMEPALIIKYSNNPLIIELRLQSVT